MAERKAYITVLSVISCFCVVCMHVNRLDATPFSDADWTARAVADGICYFAVPVFFMISGANLIDYRSRYGTKEFFRRRAVKVLFPFLFWSLAGILYFYAAGEIAELTPASVLLAIFNVSYVNTYWFFLPLFMCYLVMPLFASVEDKKEVFALLIASGVVLNVLLPYLETRFGFSLHEQLKNPVTFGYVLYLLIGYYIDHYDLPIWGRLCIYGGGIFGLYTLTVATVSASRAWGVYLPFYKGYLQLAALLYSSAVFLLFRQCFHGKRPEKLMRVLEPVAASAFGIYLIHRGLLETFDRLLPQLQRSGAAGILLETCLTFALSFGLVALMRRLPILRRLVP